MENSTKRMNTPYKLYINDKKEEDFKNQIISNKLSLRKKKLYNLLMQKRQTNTQIKTEEKNHIGTLSQISILIHKEDFNNIQSGLNMLYDYLINNPKLEKENIKYIYENIYYRLLDIICSDKSYENNKNMNKILFLINYLTTENNIFIEPVTEQLFLTEFQKIIDINFNNKNFISLIIPLLSDMLTNKKKFVQIMNAIDIIKIMKVKINENNFDKDNIENVLLLMNNFIMNINKDMTNKFKFILEYILNVLNCNNLMNNLVNVNNNDESFIMISIFDILIHMVNAQGNMEIIKKSNCFMFIKNIINNYKNININSNLYLLKCYEFLSNIILNEKTSEDKKNIVTYFYQNNSDNNSIGLPFVNELIECIKLKNKSFVYILINCIISLVNNSNEFCELYCSNNNFINILINLFNEKIPKKIKNEIITFFINIIEINNIKIYKYILNIDIFALFISYLIKKKKSKKESTKIIIYNILYFINKCLLLENAHNMNEIMKILEKYKFKETIEFLIENKDESISDISRSMFIKFFSTPENVYCQNNKKNIDDNKMIIE